MPNAERLPPGEKAEDELHEVDILARFDEALQARLRNPPVHERVGRLDVKAELVEDFVYVDASFYCWGVEGSMRFRFSVATFVRVRQVLNDVDIR